MSDTTKFIIIIFALVLIALIEMRCGDGSELHTKPQYDDRCSKDCDCE